MIPIVSDLIDIKSFLFLSVHGQRRQVSRRPAARMPCAREGGQPRGRWGASAKSALLGVRALPADSLVACAIFNHLCGAGRTKLIFCGFRPDLDLKRTGDDRASEMT